MMNIGLGVNRLLTKGFGVFCMLISRTLLVQLPSMYKYEVDFKSKAISATGTVVKTRVEEQVIANGTSAVSLCDRVNTFVQTRWRN